MEPFNPQRFLQDFGFSEAEAEVYLAVLGGAQLPRDVLLMTGRSRPTVYQSLANLAGKGLIREVGSGEALQYRGAALDQLSLMLAERETEIAHLHSELQEFIRQFSGRDALDRRPRLSLLEGNAAIRRAVSESLYSRGRELSILLPRDTYLERLGSHYLEQYFDLVASLGLRGELIVAPGEFDYIDHLRATLHLRHLNRQVADRLTVSYVIYDDVSLVITHAPGGYGWQVVSRETAIANQTMIAALAAHEHEWG